MNEIGHSGEFKQNVFIREFDDRVVKYYFIPNETMEIGKPVEMLTDYMHHYERTFYPFVVCSPHLKFAHPYFVQLFVSVTGMGIATTTKGSPRTVGRLLRAWNAILQKELTYRV